eukprot:TRINITY_DN645_c0_g1_i1.p1 TRINITY_DN645_c0_g1~~TRINITY_DN645_c0_g1_i1.p1  ORF type:complete len:470 (+),score=188.82 TRINITY_DN645_c0_g1_i1:780-2189(+)
MESKDNTDQIAREFFVKMAQVVISSRLSTSQAPFRKGKPNKWFNLSLDELDNVSEELLGWRLNPRTPLQLDIGWHPSSTSSSSSSSGMTLLERWHVSYQPLQPLQAPGTTDGGSEIPTLYKKLVVALRSVYLLLRLLPASSLARSSSNGDGQRRQRGRMSYRLLPAASAAAELPTSPSGHRHAWADWRMAPVATAGGRLDVSVVYRCEMPPDDPDRDPDRVVSSSTTGSNTYHSSADSAAAELLSSPLIIADYQGSSSSSVDQQRPAPAAASSWLGSSPSSPIGIVSRQQHEQLQHALSPPHSLLTARSLSPLSLSPPVSFGLSPGLGSSSAVGAAAGRAPAVSDGYGGGELEADIDAGRLLSDSISRLSRLVVADVDNHVDSAAAVTSATSTAAKAHYPSSASPSSPSSSLSSTAAALGHSNERDAEIGAFVAMLHAPLPLALTAAADVPLDEHLDANTLRSLSAAVC